MNLPTFDLTNVSEQNIKDLEKLTPEEVLVVIGDWQKVCGPVPETGLTYFPKIHMNPYELAARLFEGHEWDGFYKGSTADLAVREIMGFTQEADSFVVYYNLAINSNCSERLAIFLLAMKRKGQTK